MLETLSIMALTLVIAIVLTLFILNLKGSYYKLPTKQHVLPSHIKSNVSKPKLVKEIINWCINNIKHFSELPPQIEISYYKHKRKLGSYHPNDKKIKIYIHNNLSVEVLVDTIIHEYVHFVELKSEKSIIEYAKLNYSHSYQYNPFEISARKIARENTFECIKELNSRGILTVGDS